jgi:hypothetical protein
MDTDNALEELNNLAAASVAGQIPMRTTEELLAFFKNPPKPAHSFPLEQAMTSVVTIFATADANTRRAIASRLNVPAQNGLLRYAADMAVRAVKSQSPALIEQGLIALVIEGGSRDYRDSVVALAQLYRSAVQLGMDARTVFKRAALLADAGIIKRELNEFPLRPLNLP